MMQGGMGPRAGMRRPVEGDAEGDASAVGGERPGFGAGRPRPAGAGPGMGGGMAGGMGGGNRMGGMGPGGRKMAIEDAEEIAPDAQANPMSPATSASAGTALSAGNPVPPGQNKPQGSPAPPGSGPKPLQFQSGTARLSSPDDYLDNMLGDTPAPPGMSPADQRHKADGKGHDGKAHEGKAHTAKAPDGKPEGKPAGGKQEKPLNMASANYVPAPTVKAAPMRPRHWWLTLMFVVMVVLPTTGYGYYLFAFAADQYESDAGFSSRTEQAPSAFQLLGALGGVGTSSSSDMDIVYQFIRSQQLVALVDAQLNLRKIICIPAYDPLKTFPADGNIEDLVDYWKTMVVPNFDRATGLMTLTVFAFDPEDAQNIAREVLADSTAIINDLSNTAQSDTTRYSKESLTKSEDRMADAQKAVTTFRISNNILDPEQAVSGTQQVVTMLVQQLATAEIDLDMLTGTVPASDPRLAQINRRIDVIQKRMAEEQSKVGGLTDPGAPNYANLVTEYQNLVMAQDFAQKTYLTALAAYNQSLDDAQHNTRYLATYLEPTLAESSTAPQRILRIVLTALVGALAWSIVTMVFYALRDRK